MARRRVRQHLNPLAMHCLAPRAPLELPRRGRVEIELGCGDGRFISQLAEKSPDALFYGLDIREPILERGRRRFAHQRLPNLRFERCNLLVDTASLFPANRVNRFFINFPDPYFKRRTRNRRWLSEEAVRSLVGALSVGGRDLLPK